MAYIADPTKNNSNGHPMKKTTKPTTVAISSRVVKCIDQIPKLRRTKFEGAEATRMAAARNGPPLI